MKIFMVVGLAVFFLVRGQYGFAILALTSMIPYTGIIGTVMLATMLATRGWYGTAAVTGGLAIWLTGSSIWERSKTRVKKRLGQLLNGAKFAVSVALVEHYGGFEKGQSKEDIDGRLARSAAATNYLFGEPLHPDHVRDLDLAIIQSEALEWLRERPVFRKLVVQSLRVVSVLSGKTDFLGEPILAQFGREFPDAPDPNNFENLVNEAIASLPPNCREDLRARM